ncbi:hypothetical protein TD95_001318 [Thielaviopsis punctulata]|uniref:Phosphoribulokinase/uridine kinase domain-containing protein n=1 Tax=Thielaviopsis punctulata TaxID=72032 RepID=A0A0F4ZLG3_9PEZI|nr:hypothetical protein TD95_001318 [Thielaviopsis punctulata]
MPASLDDTIARLTAKVLAKLSTLPPSHRFIIAIVGIPGAGKSTLSTSIVAALRAASCAATAIPMDGFHHPRAVLSAMPDPAHAHARRGAAFTFDAAGWVALVARLATVVPGETVYAPGFDHAVKDPVQAAIAVPPECRVVVCEGNYLALNKEPWKAAAQRYDEVWLVEVARETARERLVRRHVQAGIAASVEEAEKRADENDLVNGDEILANLIDRIDERIHFG